MSEDCWGRYRFRILDEDLGPAHLVLIVVHVDRAEEVKDALLLGAPPTRPRLGRQNGVPAWPKCRCCIHTNALVALAFNRGHRRCRMPPGDVQDWTHLIRNLLKTLRYANPALLTRMFSRRPRYSTWCFTLQTGKKSQVGLRFCRVTSTAALAVALLACSPPSLWVSWSHWV